jgi:hypothetical protein
MTRRVAAVVLALALNPALVHAQDSVLTVTVPSADVHKGPSTVTPVIGHVSRGTVLPVTRNLGSWAKVPWPDAPDGVGYVHVTTGRLAGPNGAAPAPPEAVARAATAPGSPQEPAPATPTVPQRPRSSSSDRIAVRDQQHTTTISHIVGIGGMVGSMSSFGATARAWHNNHLGFQFGLTRDAMTSDVAAGRVTSLQFEPAVVYALFDHVSDYVWVRPYAGSGLSFRHQTLKLSTPAEPESAPENGVGFRAFGGTELTFAGVTRFGLSIEAGYRHVPNPFAGFEADRFSASLYGHWYIK